MKKLLLGIAVVIAAWIGYRYLTTGRFSLPAGSRSADEQKVDALARRLAVAQSQFRGANLAAGSSGVDTTSQADDAMLEVQAVLDEVRALKPELETEAVRRRAEEVERRAQTVLERSK